MGDAKELEHLPHALVDLRRGASVHTQSVRNIVVNAHMGKQRVILIHDAQVALLHGKRFHVFAVKQDAAFA